MRKTLLTAVAAVASCLTVQAQQRLALFEEFSGENCAPCAAYNPALWSLISANPSKVLLIKYQSPIPSAGPIYNQYRTVTQARLSYYSVPFAPYGRLDGTQVGDGNIVRMTQSIINQEAAIAAPFNITAAHQWTTNADSVNITVNLAAVSNYAPTNANLKLRVALIEHLSYPTAPGTNGETEFHNVVREMYPAAAGTQLANAWTTGQTQTITLKGRVPSYVNKAADGETRIVVWVQDDTNKAIPQATASTYVPLAVDAGTTALRVPTALVCTAGTTTVNPTLTLQNTGASTLSSAIIYYKVDAGAWQPYNWTGSLAASATTSVSLPTLTIGAGAHVLADSVAQPNGQRDINLANNSSSTILNVYNQTGTNPPIITGFENNGAVPANWLLYDTNGNNNNWKVVGSATATPGQNNSHYMLQHDNYSYLNGETNYAIIPADIPTGGTRTLSFYEAYAQYATENDRLEVVYSTNCGSTWTSVWNQAGATLATAPATNTYFVPTQSQWRNYRVDLSAVPANAMLAFRAVSNYGNNIYVDNVQLQSTITATTTAIAEQSLTLAPNPTNTQSVLAFSLTRGTTAHIDVIDALGRVVKSPASGAMAAGSHQVTISTADLAPGLYSVVLRTAEGSQTQRLAVVR